MMKKYFNGILSLYLLCFLLASCNDTVTLLSIGESRKLTTEMNLQSAVFGDDVTFTVRIDQQDNSQVLAEDIDVALIFSGKDKDGEAVLVTDVFDDFTGHIAMKKGEKQGFADFKVKQDIANFPISGTITAYVRGYMINVAERPLVISDKYYTMLSLKNNSDNIVNEYGYFTLVASIGAPAEEDIKIYVTPAENDKERFENLPEFLTIRTGYRTSESEVVKIIGEVGRNSFESVSLSFETESEAYPLYGSELEIVVNDLDGGLKEEEKLTDEHWVYTNPEQMFVSSDNKKEVSNWDEIKAISALEIREGDPHPNISLADQGWTFLNSYEFHPIDALTQSNSVNQWGNRPPRYMSAQNVANTQKVQAVVNEKYATMTQDGYLRMWCAHDPGLSTTGGIAGTKDYGVSAIYASKFDGSPTGADSWESSNVRVLPGTRVEVRIRVRGKKHSFNSAVWFQGNIRGVKWSTYGEVDLLENPANKNSNLNAAWQTFHWNDKSNEPGDKYKPSSGQLTLNDMDQFDIYWMEWRDNGEIALGINGKENVCARADGTYIGHANGTASWNNSTHWPFSDTYNVEGLHLLLTFAGCNEWSLGDAVAEAAAKDGSWANDFKHISYEESKSSNDTPRMEIDYIRFYKKASYNYLGGGIPTRNKPMY